MKSNTSTDNDIIKYQQKSSTTMGLSKNARPKKRRLVVSRQTGAETTTTSDQTKNNTSVVRTNFWRDKYSNSTRVTAAKSSSSTILNDIWCFDESDHQQREDRHESISSSSISSSLPLLLLERESGNGYCSFGTKSGIRNKFHQTINWQRRMLVASSQLGKETATKSENIQCNNNDNDTWRKYCHRRIPFTLLNTPQSDAVLALDPTGSYIISVGDGSTVDDDNNNNSLVTEEPSLVVRLYGVTTNLSPSSTHAVINDNNNYNNSNSSQSLIRQLPSKVISPLVATVPIAYKKRSHTTIENEWSIHRAPPSPALFPIRIWLSSDNCIGIVISRLWQHEGWTGVRTKKMLLPGIEFFFLSFSVQHKP
jgi:hypothetical protein